MYHYIFHASGDKSFAYRGVIVSARADAGSRYDYVSRFFYIHADEFLTSEQKCRGLGPSVKPG